MNPAFALLGGMLVLLACITVGMIRTRRDARLDRLLTARLAGLRLPADPLTTDQLSATWQARLALRMPHAVRIRLARADIEVTMPQIIIPALGLAVIDVILLELYHPLFAVAATAMALLVPILLVQLTAARRLSSFIEALPSLFDQVKHLLLAGNSLQQALTRSIDASLGPVARYLQPVSRRVQNGAPVADSILWLADRLDCPELFIFGTGVQTNACYGGRMANMLANLSQIVRDGLRVNRELKSATAETRLSALVLSLLPVCVAGIIAIMNPSYMSFFIDTTQGQQMAIFAVGLQLAGMLVMRRILRLDF